MDRGPFTITTPDGARHEPVEGYDAADVGALIASGRGVLCWGTGPNQARPGYWLRLIGSTSITYADPQPGDVAPDGGPADPAPWTREVFLLERHGSFDGLYAFDNLDDRDRYAAALTEHLGEANGEEYVIGEEIIAGSRETDALIADLTDDE